MAVHQRKQADKKKNAGTGVSNEKQVQDVQTTVSKVPWKKIFVRFLLSLFMVLTVYWTSKKDQENVFASQKEKLRLNTHEINCSPEYKKEMSKFKGCAPKSCGRVVTDIVVSAEESAHLLSVAKRGLSLGGSSGGVSILDLHSGALSHGKSFINVYQKMKNKSKVFNAQDFDIYRNVRHKIQQMIAFNFGIQVNKLYLTHPTFFSEMSSRAAKTTHDEYWHVHVDKETYPSFHYTSLLYLNDYGIDFTGGRFVFVDKVRNMTVEPRTGRISAFTSGAENPHYVEKVISGLRYALTVSFTCDPQYAIKDPTVEKLQ